MAADNPIDNEQQSNDARSLVSASVSIGGAVPPDTTVKEVIIGESLLNPSVHAAVTLQSAMYTAPKNWDAYKGTIMNLSISDADGRRNALLSQTLYRIDNRHFANLNTGQVEELTLHGCDFTVLEDAATILSKSFKCTTPDQVVNYALGEIGASSRIVMPCGPARDYIAESIHPFQVIQQQANMALYGSDPSFIHFMTFNENSGQCIHRFQPLGQLIRQSAGYQIYSADTGVTGRQSFSDGFNVAVTYNFPCDFDLLSDILNGIGPQGQNINSVKTMNLASGIFDMMGSILGGGVGSGNIFSAITNLGSVKQQGGCESKVEQWLLTRQARMSLLEKDKIALRVVVPWSPWLHAGNVFHFKWGNRFNPGQEIYGSGDYLIVHLTHNIQFGGYATTTLDCIANTY